MKAVFLDRDGVILCKPEGKYLRSLEDARFEVGSLGALVKLAEDYDLYVVTNQAGIGKGEVDWNTTDAIHEWISEAVERRGGHIEAFFTCPHTEEDHCQCRKPGALFLQTVFRQHPELSPHNCYMVGDSLVDVQCAQRAKVNPVLVMTGDGSETYKEMIREHSIVGVSFYDDLYSFAFQLKNEKR
jgi:D-glycero-D-manno-heptose 1,7-bisphosphate phosphatase